MNDMVVKMLITLKLGVHWRHTRGLNALIFIPLCVSEIFQHFKQKI